MFVLCWNHTRTGRKITREFKTYGQAWIHIITVREIFPDHPFVLNGNPI